MEPLDLVIRGARLVTPEGEIRAELYIRDGRVAGIGSFDAPARAHVDAAGLVLLPGFVDAHVHFMDPGATDREDFPTGSAAAAAAGVTTVLEHTHAAPVHSAGELAAKVEYLRRRSVVDFGLGAHFSPVSLDDVVGVWQAGAAFIKVFTCTTHGIPAAEGGRFAQAMQRLVPAGGVFLVHAEDEWLTRVAEATLRAQGRQDGGIIPEWRNPLAEQVAVGTTAAMALATGATVAIAHCSHPAVVDLVYDFRARGARLEVESCPQYFFLYEREADELGAFRKFTPPARARSPQELEAMWQRLRDGRITYMASDHAPATRAQKLEGSVWDVHFGLPGIDTTAALLLDAAFTGRLPLSRVVEAYAAAPARLYGLYPRKGALLVGSDADFVLVDPTARRTLRDAAVLSKAGWTPFAGREVQGAVIATYLRGQKVADNGRCVAPPGTGQWVPGKGARTPAGGTREGGDGR